MALLSSPGVSVTITDESQYVTSGQGTIPLIVFATAANKASPVLGGTIAPYTVPTKANTLYLATSQQDLIQNFGNPIFYSTQGTPLNGYELNEYGLWAAWSYLGIANQCYVLRADVDLASLAPTTTAPSGPPVAGTYWLDTSSTVWGVFQSNGSTSPGSAWNSVSVLVAQTANVGSNPNPSHALNTEQATDTDDTNWPLTSFGSDGNVCVVPTTASNYFYERVGGDWFRIGSYDWAKQHQTVVTATVTSPTVVPTTTVIINTTTVTITSGHTTAAGAVTDINAATITNITASVAQSGALVITNTAGGSVVIGAGTANTALGLTAKTYAGVSVTRNNNATYPDGSVAGSFWIKGNPSNKGANWAIKYYNSTGTWSLLTAPFYAFDSTAADSTANSPDPGKDAAALAAFTAAVGNVYVGYDVVTGDQQIRRWSGTSWQPLSYEADAIAPSTMPAAGTNWFNTNFNADILYCNGENWLGYRAQFPETDIFGVQIAGSAPVSQTNGDDLVQGDLWIDGSNLESYPLIYMWNESLMSWTLIDNTDNTTPFGIIFADARQDSGTAYQVNGESNSSQTTYAFSSTMNQDMALSSFVDPDAPDPRNYPAGMLLFNTRYSTYNVKQYNPAYFNAGGFSPTTDYTAVANYNVGDPNTFLFPALSDPARWVTASGNQTNGAPYMGRRAQRIMVVTKLAASIASNQNIRSEIVYFNLMAAPGYPETIPDFISLNTDMNDIAFTVGDTPARLASDGTSIQNWATNAANVSVTGEDGLTVSDDYTGLWYPWGLATNLDGTDIMVPPSAIALVTIAYNDQVAYPWYAPAGFNRGLVTNAGSVGYLDATSGEFVPVILNQGQRDVIYTNNINPIAYIPNRGLVVYGQKTLDPTATALDRVNVARLMNYIAYNLDNILKPFLFEPNTTTTRATVTTTVQNFLAQLVTLNGLYDYAVVCNNTNNTPAEIDANELWVDVAVQPVITIEFIYVPVRVLTTQAVA